MEIFAPCAGGVIFDAAAVDINRFSALVDIAGTGPQNAAGTGPLDAAGTSPRGPNGSTRRGDSRAGL